MRRLAGWSAVASAIVSYAVGIPFLLAAWELLPRTGLGVLINEPAGLVTIDPEKATILRWAYLLDAVGWYLLLVPLILFLRSRFREDGLADLAAVGGLAYVVMGSMAAVLMATAAPRLIETFAGTTGATHEAARLTFAVLSEGVHQGVWQTLDPIALGAWLLITGIHLRSAGAGMLGTIPMILGIVAFPAAVATALGASTVALALFAPGVLFPMWILWIGVRLLRRPDFL
jgi:hypothetical protein